MPIPGDERKDMRWLGAVFFAIPVVLVLIGLGAGRVGLTIRTLSETLLSGAKLLAFVAIVYLLVWLAVWILRVRDRRAAPKKAMSSRTLARLIFCAYLSIPLLGFIPELIRIALGQSRWTVLDVLLAMVAFEAMLIGIGLLHWLGGRLTARWFDREKPS